MSFGTLYTVGTGPGDPELLTVKAARLIRNASVLAYFAKRGAKGHARTIAEPYATNQTEELRFEYPCTTEVPRMDPDYEYLLDSFYEQSAYTIRTYLQAGRDVVLLCEGDPFFFGSSMYVFDRLRGSFEIQVVPGVSGMSGCWASARLPMLHGNDIFTVLPATLPKDVLIQRLAECDAAVVMKIGRHLQKVRAVLIAAKMAERAIYVERGTMESERVMPLLETEEIEAPYFSLVLVPGRQSRK